MVEECFSGRRGVGGVAGEGPLGGGAGGSSCPQNPGPFSVKSGKPPIENRFTTPKREYDQTPPKLITTSITITATTKIAQQILNTFEDSSLLHTVL